MNQIEASDAAFDSVLKVCVCGKHLNDSVPIHELHRVNACIYYVDKKDDIIKAWQPPVDPKRSKPSNPKRGIGNICFDIDGTLCNEICFTEAEVRKATLNKKMAKEAEWYYQNAFLIMYTARRDELIPATLEWLRRNNVRWHAFSNIKIPASMYVDDKAKEI